MRILYSHLSEGSLCKQFRPRTMRWLFTVLSLIPFASAQTEQTAADRLIYAMRERNWPEINTVLKAGVDLNFKDRDGMTPLTEAIEDNLSGLAKKLILMGADPNLPSGDGASPLIHASVICNTELGEFLLKHGTRINDQARDGSTALMTAAYGCKGGQMVKLLLRAGAEVNLRDKNGETALHAAAFNGDERAVRELVAAGVDVGLKNADGETALTIAKDRVVGRERSHDRIVSFLTEHSTQL